MDAELSSVHGKQLTMLGWGGGVVGNKGMCEYVTLLYKGYTGILLHIPD